MDRGRRVRLREIGLICRVVVAGLRKRETAGLPLWRTKGVEVERLVWLMFLLVVGAWSGAVGLLWAWVVEVRGVPVVVVPLLGFVCLE